MRAIFLSWRDDVEDATGDERREILGAIIVNKVWKRSLRRACGRVLGSLRSHSDLRDDLFQETTCLLFSDLIQGKIKYRDQGSHAFLSWLRKMIYRTELDAFHGPHVISIDQPTLMETEDLDSLALKIEPRVSREDWLAGISQLKSKKTRRVMRHWVHGMSLAQSARKIGRAISTVWEIRQRGRDELRRLMLAD